MNIDFEKQSTIEDKLFIVKQLYERFNLNYGNLIDMKKVEQALNNIIVFNEDLSNVPEGIKISHEHGSNGICWKGKIYVGKEASIDTLFHEILHYITESHSGVMVPLWSAYSEEEVNQRAKEYGENRFVRQIEQLDESMTRYITELAIPEAKIEDSYEYGASILRKYCDSLNEKGIDSSFVIEMYLSGSEDAASKFKSSFGGRFNDFLDTIELINNLRFYIIKKPKKGPMSSSEMSSIIENATNSLKVR